MNNFEVLSDITKDRVDIFNSVLRDLGHLSIFENDHFEIDSESVRSHFVKVRTNGPDTCPNEFYFEEDSLRVDIAGINEAFEFNADYIDQNRNDLREFLRILLTSFILIEFKGSPHWKSRVYFFDDFGRCVLKSKLRGIVNLFSEWEFEKNLFSPLLRKLIE